MTGPYAFEGTASNSGGSVPYDAHSLRNMFTEAARAQQGKGPQKTIQQLFQELRNAGWTEEQLKSLSGADIARLLDM